MKRMLNKLIPFVLVLAILVLPMLNSMPRK